MPIVSRCRAAVNPAARVTRSGASRRSGSSRPGGRGSRSDASTLQMEIVETDRLIVVATAGAAGPHWQITLASKSRPQPTIFRDWVTAQFGIHPAVADFARRTSPGCRRRCRGRLSTGNAPIARTSPELKSSLKVPTEQRAANATDGRRAVRLPRHGSAGLHATPNALNTRTDGQHSRRWPNRCTNMERTRVPYAYKQLAIAVVTQHTTEPSIFTPHVRTHPPH